MTPPTPRPVGARHTGAFQLYDINQDGQISYDEMLQIVRSIYKMTGQMVKLPEDEDTPEKVRLAGSPRPRLRSYAGRAAPYGKWRWDRADTDGGAARGQDLPQHGLEQGRQAHV